MLYNVSQVVGLDLSLTGTGISVCDISSESFQLSTLDTSKLTGLKRMEFIRNSVMEKMDKASFVVMEDFAFSRGTGAYSLGGLGYLVRWSLWSKKMPFILVKPNQLKKFLTGKGNVDKNVMLKEVYKKWNFDLDDDNQADALVLSQIGRALINQFSVTTAPQKEVLKDLRKQKLEGDIQLLDLIHSNATVTSSSGIKEKVTSCPENETSPLVIMPMGGKKRLLKTGTR